MPFINKTVHTRPVGGLHVLPWDAARLAARTRSLAHASMVFDVRPSSGRVPPTRWIFSELPIWTLGSPAILGFLPFPLLKPKLLR